jgi:beta-glucosidase
MLAVFPRSEKPDSYNRVRIADINRIIAGLDDGKRVFFMDIGKAFLQPDGSISRDILYDFLHPAPAGYQIWADAMKSKLAELLK